MKLLAAYLFNEYSGSGIPAQFLDFSPNKFLADTLSNISMSTVNSNGYDALFGGLSTISYFTSSTFKAAGLKSFAVAFKIKFTNNGFYLVNYPGSFSVQIDSTGKVIFEVIQSGTFTVTSAYSINDGNYHTIVCNCSSTEMQLYVDSILSATASCTITGLLNPTGHLITGAQTTTSSVYLIGNLSWLIFFNTSLTNRDIVEISSADGKGMDINTSSHSFKTGDLVGNAGYSLQGVVSWVKDAQNFTVLPYSLFNALDIFKYGNIFNTLRQNILEFDNNFDGNGNGQIRIKTGINSFASLISCNEFTIDYRGVNFAGNTQQLWSRTDDETNPDLLEDTLYTNIIPAGTMQYDNDLVKGEIAGTNSATGLVRFYVESYLTLSFSTNGDWYMRYSIYRVNNTTLKVTAESGGTRQCTVITGLNLAGGFSSGFSSGFSKGAPTNITLTGQGAIGTIKAMCGEAEYTRAIN